MIDKKTKNRTIKFVRFVLKYGKDMIMPSKCFILGSPVTFRLYKIIDLYRNIIDNRIKIYDHSDSFIVNLSYYPHPFFIKIRGGD